MGFCVHVACILWYLGCARHAGYQPREMNINRLINAAIVPEDSDDEDDNNEDNEDNDGESNEDTDDDDEMDD